MMVSLLIYYSLMITFHFSAVSAQDFSFTQNATAPSSVCEGSDVTLQCVVVLNNPDNTMTVRDNVWSRNSSGMVTAINTVTPISNHRVVFNSTTRVFTDLVITNVTLEDNNAVYICTATGATITSSVVLNVIGGPPDDVNNVSISLDTPTACSILVQWNNVSSDPVCGSVWYTVTVSTEGILIHTDNTTMTNYNVTGLNNNTVYHVNVTASNNAGSSDSTGTSAMTNSGLPSSSPNITAVTTLNDTSFTVNWTMPDPNYSCIVICTNLNTGVINNFIVPENTNSYTVTVPGLVIFSDNVNYTVQVTAVNMCGNMTSDPINITTSTLATSTQTSSPTNVMDTSNESSGSSTTTIIIIIVVVVAAVLAVIIITLILSLLAWRHYHKESGFIKPNDNENDENHYAQPNGNAPQEKNNEEYAYAINGPRGVAFPTNSEMPQQQ